MLVFFLFFNHVGQFAQLGQYYCCSQFRSTVVVTQDGMLFCTSGLPDVVVTMIGIFVRLFIKFRIVGSNGSSLTGSNYFILVEGEGRHLAKIA